MKKNLFERISQLDVGDFFRVLEFEKAITAVAGHVDQDVGAGIG